MKGVVAAAPLCLALCGCDLLFQTQHVEPRIDAAVDAPAACEDPSPFGTNCRTVQLPVSDDTYLAEASPDTPFGGRDAVLLSTSDPALFKFDTTTIEVGERIAALKLTLDPYVSSNATACSSTGTTCATCPTPVIGRWRMHWATTAWSQATATWNQAARPTTAWTLPGASSIPEDRSELVAMGIPNTSLVVMDVAPEDLLARSPDCYRSSDSLAILVTLEGAAYFDAREDTPCNSSTESPPLLEVTLCR